jgi:hypothetical protein
MISDTNIWLLVSLGDKFLVFAPKKKGMKEFTSCLSNVQPKSPLKGGL